MLISGNTKIFIRMHTTKIMIIIKMITDKFRTLYNIWRFILLKVSTSFIPVKKDINVYKKVNINIKNPKYVEIRFINGKKAVTPTIKGIKARLLTIT